MRQLTAHLKVHALIFEPKSPSRYDASAGLRLLAVFVLLEVVIGPRATLFALVGVPAPGMLARVTVMLAAALILVRYFAGVRLAQIGLYGWRRWNTSEKSYFIQVTPLAVCIFSIVTWTRLRATAADSSTWGSAAPTLLAYFLWGFYQEVMYRGILQTELVRRWGAVAGISIANVAYTFGPLHLYYFTTYSAATRWALFGAVFAIGLFFGLLFRRSGNLAIVGILHGIGDVFLSGLPRVKR